MLREFLCALFLLGYVAARNIPESTLEELTNLIDEYKESVGGNTKEEEIAKCNPFVISRKTETCVSDCRVTKSTCDLKADVYKEKLACAEEYVGCFPQCFFGLVAKHENECEDNCLCKFDQCNFSVNEVEKFNCYNARTSCEKDCRPSRSAVSKRGCFEDCSGEYKTCAQQPVGPQGYLQCIVLESDCKTAC